MKKIATVGHGKFSLTLAVTAVLVLVATSALLYPLRNRGTAGDLASWVYNQPKNSIDVASAHLDTNGTVPEPAVCPPCPTDASLPNTKSLPPSSSPILESNLPLGSKKFNYSYLADVEALNRGLVTLGERWRLRLFVNKLISGQPVTVFAIGGSITAGQGAIYENPYVERFYKWIQNTFPNPGHRLRNTAYGGTTSNTFAACARSLVKDADFVFVEFTINDPDLDGRLGYPPVQIDDVPDPKIAPGLKAYERLTRYLLQLPSHPAVILLHSYSWFISGGKDKKRGSFYETLELEYRLLGEYYRLPQLSVRNAFYQYMVEGRPGYQAHVWRREHESSTNESDLFYYDFVHPQDGTGHVYMSELLIRMLEIGADEVALNPISEADRSGAAQPIPVPMLKNNYERKGIACVIGNQMKEFAVETKGFRFIVESKNKSGWIGTQPGDELVLRIDTRVESSLNAMKRNGMAETKLLVSYLKSHEHMGVFRISCRNDCACGAEEIDGHAKQFSLSQIHELKVTERAECHVVVTVLNRTNSGEHKVKISGWMVVEQGGSGAEGEGLMLMGAEATSNN